MARFVLPHARRRSSSSAQPIEVAVRPSPSNSLVHLALRSRRHFSLSLNRTGQATPGNGSRAKCDAQSRCVNFPCRKKKHEPVCLQSSLACPHVSQRVLSLCFLLSQNGLQFLTFAISALISSSFHCRPNWADCASPVFLLRRIKRLILFCTPTDCSVEIN